MSGIICPPFENVQCVPEQRLALDEHEAPPMTYLRDEDMTLQLASVAQELTRKVETRAARIGIGGWFTGR